MVHISTNLHNVLVIDKYSSNIGLVLHAFHLAKDSNSQLPPTPLAVTCRFSTSAGQNTWLLTRYSFLSPSYQWGFYKIWSTRPSPPPNLRGRNCPLSAMGVRVSLVCSNSTVFLQMDVFSQYGEVINSINPRDSYMHHWPRSPLTLVMA